MARIRNGILGGFNGKVGEVIGQNYAGVSTMRAMPKYVSNPRTPSQVAHRDRFRASVKFFEPLSYILKFSTWQTNAVYNSFNRAVNSNFDKFYFTIKGDLVCDLFDLEIGEFYSVGLPVSSASASFVGDLATFSFTWSSAKFSPWATDDDEVILFVAHDVGDGMYKVVFADFIDQVRGDGVADVSFYVPSSVLVGTSFYYAFTTVTFKSADGSHEPHDPKKVIKIPSKKIAKFSAGDFVTKS